MRILICNWKDLGHPRAGGAEVWTDGIARAWVNAGHAVTLACSRATGQPAHEERGGVTITRGGDYRFGVHAHVRSVYERASRDFDVVLDEINTRPFGAPRWAGRSKVIAFVHQVAREVWFRETAWPVALAGRFVLEPAWLRGYRRVPVYTPSVSTATSLHRYGLSHACALPQGSARPEISVDPVVKESSPTFVFVGRLCAMKRPLHAMAAFRRVQRVLPEARLWIMGRGPQEDRVRRHLGPGMELLGAVSAAERDERMSRAHALLATSVREGWGLVVSEAAALGTFTIGYSVPGLVDSIPATGGVLVPPTPRALGAAMLDVARAPALAPRPSSTGTVPFDEVASRLLATSSVTTDA
jgi:glycosyltransferase involved in cell wall biosynthesis